jgi:acetyltransferase
MGRRYLDSLFRPKSIAFIEASNEPGCRASVFIRNLLQGGFEGPIMPVTGKYKSVAGILAYPNIASLPLVPELAIIDTPPSLVPLHVDELGRRGTRAAILLTAGMDRVQDKLGWTLQEAMLEAARRHNVRILGPHSRGLIVPEMGLNACSAPQPALPGNIAFISQSGAMCTGILDWARAQGIGFSHFVSLGDCADVGFAEVLDYLACEPTTRAILLYFETIDHRRAFMSAARAAARNKPVLAIKVGRTSQAIHAVDPYPGGLVRSDQVYDAALRRVGILRVSHIEELFAAVETLAHYRPLKGGRLAIISNGYGIGIMAVDALIQGGGNLAQLSTETVEKLDAALPAIWSASNPVDISGDATEQRYTETLRILIQADAVDAVLVMHAPMALTSSNEIANGVVKTACEQGGNVLTCWFGGEAVSLARKQFAKAGIPTYESPSMAVRAYLHIVHCRRNLDLLMQTPRSVPIEFTPSRDLTRTAIRNVLASGREVMNDPEAKTVLAAYGMPTLPSRFALDPEQAADLAKDIGFPVAIKLLANNKSARLNDAGTAVFDLNDSKAVQQAAESMILRFDKLAPDASLQGFAVQKMVRRPGAHKLAIGVTTDPIFGPILMFGHGGSTCSITGDIAVALPPLNMNLAWELLSRTPMYKYKLLQGYAGHAAADIDAICLTLIKLSQLIIDIPCLTELQINPLFADENGVLAVETWMRLQPNPPPAEDRLAIQPYPQELEEDCTLRTGLKVRLRPIRPEDEPEHHIFFSRLTLQDPSLALFRLPRQITAPTDGKLYTDRL